jgi:hypothetical protein
MKGRGINLFLALGVALSWGVAAHHSGAAYDMKHSITKKVEFTKFDWQNPHIALWITEVGTGKKWRLESLAPIVYRRYGVNASTFNKGVGTTVTMTWCPTLSHLKQNDVELGVWQAIRLADGTEFSEQGLTKQKLPPPGACEP